MSMIKAQVPALIAIDIQDGFHDSFWGPRNNPKAEEQMNGLFKFWREQRWPVIHVQHLSKLHFSPLRPSQPGVEFMDFAKPLEGERVFQKSVNSAFIGTDLESFLVQSKIKNLVMMGFTSDHCVSTSTRMAANLGFQVSLSADALATFDRKNFRDGSTFPAETVHQVSLASLHEEFATVYTQQGLLHAVSNSALNPPEK